MHSHAQTLFIFQVMEKKLMAKMLSQKQRYNLKFLTYEASEAPLHAFIKLSILVMPNPSESTHELWRWMMWRIDKSKRGEIFITVLNIVSHLSAVLCARVRASQCAFARLKGMLVTMATHAAGVAVETETKTRGVPACFSEEQS